LNGRKNDIVILGGGLSGLSAGYILTNAGFPVQLYEGDAKVGGLSKTIERNGFRFDLGGHRFFTNDGAVDALVQDLMGQEMVPVRRSSKIYLRDQYFDYPLRPFNAMFSLGIPTTARILADYVWETVQGAVKKKDLVSLEDWVVSNFGRTMFTLYFKEYSEKVWGIDCSRISATWVAQRIQGLSLAKAVTSAVFKSSGKGMATLTDSFTYPSLGIGRISDRLRDEIEKIGDVHTGTKVVRVNHDSFRVESVTVRDRDRQFTVPAEEYVSTIPLPALVNMLAPAPPAPVLEAAGSLRFRDLVIVAIMVDRERVTDQTWIYIPEQKIPFGRIHEPTNWSPAMAPERKSLLVMEYFSFKGDAVWNRSDETLTDLTVDNLVRLGFIDRREVLDSMIVRVPNAYPLFEIGYDDHAGVLFDYLQRFSNLHIAGRSGMFRYYNMDVAIRSGMETADTVMRKSPPANATEQDELVLART
jgi:protoporphyrinogen oxidase